MPCCAARWRIYGVYWVFEAMTAANASPPPQPAPLPPLREDILLAPGPRRPDGAPSWVLQDPAANAFFRIGWREFEILSRWHLSDAAAIAEAAGAETTLPVQREHVVQVAAFLSSNGLARQSAAKLVELQAKAKRRGVMVTASKWLGELLFRKIPLLAPDPFLRATVGFVRPLFTRGFLFLTAGLLILAIYLVSRQWGQFAAGYDHLYSLEGAIGIAVALTIAKSVHELAHAYRARICGVDVPSMGVSLILLWPVLYTETSGAWRVPDRRKRLLIAVAGVGAEMVLAVFAVLAWSFLDPGWLRNTMQFAATSLVVLSLAINANPLMRFDGYFVLSDLTGIENLQSRAFGVLGWSFRRIMAGAREPFPEPGFSRRTKAGVMIYGAALGLYRISLYSGIAYGLAAWVFPALGLTLALLVVMCFLVQPVSNAVVAWFKSAIKRLGPVLGACRVGACLTLLALPLIVPWRTSLMLPVVLRLGKAHAVFAPEPGLIGRLLVRDGQSVSAGDRLIEIAAPDLVQKLSADRAKAGRLSILLDRHLTQADYREEERVEEEELRRLRVEISGLEARRNRLILAAPSAGIVRDIEPGLKTGTWIRNDQPLMRVVVQGEVTAEAYIEERDLGLVAPEAEGTFWFDGSPLGSIPARIRSIYAQAVPRIEAAIIGGPGGGPIQVKQSADHAWVPETAVYKAELTIGALPAWAGARSLETRGFANIATPPRNLAGRIWDRIVGVWRREIG